MASGSEDEVIANGEEEVRPKRATRASARRGKKAAPSRGGRARRGRSSVAPVQQQADSSIMSTDAVSEDEAPPVVAAEVPFDTEVVSDDELPASKPPVPEEIPDAEEVSEDELPPEKSSKKRAASKGIDGDDATSRKKVRDVGKESSKRKIMVDSDYDPSSPTSENGEHPPKKAAVRSPPTSDNENEEPPPKKAASRSSSSPKKDIMSTDAVSEDEAPPVVAAEVPFDTEVVSDDELPASKPPVPEEIPDAEEVSEDELPPEKSSKKRAASNGIDGDDSIIRKKVRDGVKGSSKRKIPVDGEYDPSSPTSENEEHPSKKAALRSSPTSDNENEEHLSKKAALRRSPSSDNESEEPSPKKASSRSSSSPKKEAKPKALPELEKYWKAVKDDSADFTGWTYLLQYVDQENDVEAAREAYDAFLSHYPYCYGYWRKFADYEKKKGNREKCEEVFERGLKAIPLSVDLWIHYLNYCRAVHGEEEDFLREQYEKALDACGMEFRSDRLWESYIKWEAENKQLQNVTYLYDRLLATPTQSYTTHFESFQDHVNQYAPNKILSVDEFLTIREEVKQQLKAYEQPTPVATDDAAPPGEEADAPPGEESEQVKAAKSDEETTALRERIIAIRRKIHKNTINAVFARWNYEEGIKRPYFHVKPLERCQLKNWKQYLDFEIDQNEVKRTIVLFERCLIACALYDEFWIKFVRYLQSLTEGDWTEKIRDVLRRACTIHHSKKPNLHLFWSEFEEIQGNYAKASEVLCHIEKLVPGMLQIAYRRINLERRRGNLDKACELYEHYINTSKNKAIVVNTAIKYARFCWKIQNDVEKAIGILKKALEKDKESTRLYLQLVSMEMERSPMDEAAVVEVLDQCLARDMDPDQKVMFAQRKMEFLEDFGSDIVTVQRAYEELQKLLKQCKERKKKADADSKGSGNLPATNYPPPNYSQNGSCSQASSNYSTAAYPSSAVATTTSSTSTTASTAATGNYNQYNQYSQSGDYQNYQNWGYSQTGYSGYNQGWGGYYNY